MHSKKIQKLTFTLMFLFFTSCSSNNEQIIDNTSISPVPISEFQERLELSTEKAMEKVISILEGYSFEIPGGLSTDNRFATSSVKIKDKMCQGQYINNAMLPCEVKIFGNLIPINSDTTQVRLMYQENCLGQHHINSVCKDSNAEKLLFSILQELKE